MKCQICQSTQLDFRLYSKDRMFQLPGLFKIYLCRSCDVLSIQPHLKPAKLASHYPARKYYSYNAQDKKGFFSRLRAYSIRNQYSGTIFARITRLFAAVPAMPSDQKGGKLLDIGCGSGETLAQLQELGWEGYGIDRDKQAIEAAKTRGVKMAVLGTHKDLRRKFTTNVFDAVRLYHVIEHIDDPSAALASITKILKPDGELIVGTPNAGSLLARVFGTYWYNLDSPRHLVIFTPETLKKLLRGYGYQKIDITFASAGGLAGSLQYVLNEKLKLNLDLVNKVWVILFFYPLEKLLDAFGVGDVFVIRARKGSNT